ncbi:MAG: P63C domain-containing protein, partial [Terriglobales bacterium]
MTEKADATEAAKALSALGASKGGVARANALTPEQRSEIARTAGAARWGMEGVVRATHGSPERPLRIGDWEVTCYVLEDGRRVISQRGLQTAIGMSTSGGSNGAHRTAKFIEKIEHRLNVDNDLSVRMKNPILLVPPTGGLRAYGYEATTLIDVCELILKARDTKGGLLPSQEKYATAADIVIRAFAKVGIIAVIDEVTGYQDVRAKDALAKILEAFIAKELRKWVSTFPVDYYKELFRLRGWKFPQLPKDQRKRPVIVGKITNDVVYDRLAPGVRSELYRLTPRDEKGRLKHKLFQRLTHDVGHPKLREHLASVTTLMKASDSWDQFK